LGRRYGDNAYAAEELIAELGAAFVCGHLGLSTEPRPDHAQYVQSWLTVMKSDKRAIFTAASKAQQAADYLIERAGQASKSAAVGSPAGVFATCA
jgi:antirestriction protein ArdC